MSDKRDCITAPATLGLLLNIYRKNCPSPVIGQERLSGAGPGEQPPGSQPPLPRHYDSSSPPAPHLQLVQLPTSSSLSPAPYL